MENKTDGGPAFPFVCSDVSTHQCADSGMSLRDYFAAKAMQANRSRLSSYNSWDDLATDAWEIADAMLRHR